MKNSRVRKILLLNVAMLFAFNLLLAQNKSISFGAEEITLNSEVLNEQRIISVYLPEFYETTKQNYPVIYLLDGRTHFQHAIGAVSFLAKHGQMPESIIVSIHNVDRNRDFSPVNVEKIPTSGGADKFLNFLSDELAVYMNKNYRTSEFSLLVGHSFGGTFAVHSLLTKPEVFDAYVAISPYLHFAESYLVKQAETELKSAYKNKKHFYMTVGDEPKYFEPLQKFASLVAEKSSDAINFEYQKMMDENHGSIPYISLYKGVQYAFADWQLSKETFKEGLAAIDKHYKQVSLKYGSEITTPEKVINKLGYSYIWEQDYESAVSVLLENTKRFPNSANVYDSLGEAYENSDENSLAAENYKKACELGKKNNDKNLAVYKKNYERVSLKLSTSNK